MLPAGWQEMTYRLTQVDSGLTEYVWGMNGGHQLFFVEIDNVLSQVSGTMHHISAGESGVWGVGLKGNVFFRSGIKEETPKGE